MESRGNLGDLRPNVGVPRKVGAALQRLINSRTPGMAASALKPFM